MLLDQEEFRGSDVLAQRSLGAIPRTLEKKVFNSAFMLLSLTAVDMVSQLSPFLIEYLVRVKKSVEVGSQLQVTLIKGFRNLGRSYTEEICHLFYAPIKPLHGLPELNLTEFCSELTLV
eukprot:Gb_11007 [translate_table: standard]